MNNSTTSLSKILNGINSTLNIANKAIPLYQQTKPMIKTVTQTYKNLKNSKTDLNNLIKLMKVKNTIKKDMSINTSTQAYNTNNNKTITNSTYSNINNPKFFI